jgi:hypothetical protein
MWWRKAIRPTSAAALAATEAKMARNRFILMNKG